MRKPFEEALNRTKQDIERSRAEHEAAAAAYATGNIKEANRRAFSYAAASEKQVLQARDLPAYTGHPEAKTRMQRQIRELFPVVIHEPPERDWLGFSIPALLPKKEKGSALYIRLSLYAALSHYYREKEPPRIGDCTIVVRHRYDERRPEREYRDHDNIELNAVIDAIAMFSLVDDSPLRCQHYYCTKPAKQNATEILLMPHDRFIQWLVGSRSEERAVK